jgi:predicted TIM-barrel fold metal-dependent hydrolase
MTDLDYQLVDFDNHYYEPLDAWSRHLDERIKRQRRGVEIVTQGKRTYAAIGGRLSGFVPNITFDPVAAPGSLEAYFRGEAMGQRATEMARVEPLQPAYQQREPRLRVMAEQGVEEIVLLPTFSYCLEESLCDDIEAMHATISAFNRWLDEEWSLSGPTIAAPLIALSDVDAALDELRWALDRGARVVTMTPGPVRLPGDDRASPANRRFDPVWQLINDAGITVAYHAADAGYFRYFRDYDDPPVFDAFSPKMRLGSLWSVDRPMQDTIAVMVMQRLFERFPNLRIVSVEQGSDWLLVLLDKLTKLYHRRTNLFAEDPVDTIRRHLWICPFWEDDIDALIAAVGPERVVFGSDWPHPEGVAEPRDFVKHLGDRPADEVRQIMRENGSGLLTTLPLASK